MARHTQNIPHPYTLSSAQEWIDKHPLWISRGELYPFAIIQKADGLLCGTMSLGVNKQHSRGELAYWVGKPFWGKGYATEAARFVLRFAFTEISLNRVAAHHFVENPASGKVMKKLGMKFEGRFLQHYKKWDTFHDTDHYAILKSDFSVGDFAPRSVAL